eukprot:5347620-Pleurochrysis_carterae.AAC.1
MPPRRAAMPAQSRRTMQHSEVRTEIAEIDSDRFPLQFDVRSARQVSHLPALLSAVVPWLACR